MKYCSDRDHISKKYCGYDEFNYIRDLDYIYEKSATLKEIIFFLIQDRIPLPYHDRAQRRKI
ncbi:hypothetical protein EK904_012220 [Melospiza melodia maxima]|nr:hypothetical protein EK904_012220 [Melospiza melodia maxima]